MKYFKKIQYILKEAQSKKISGLFIMLILSGFFEAVGIGVVLPFISIVNDPGILKGQIWLINIFKLFNVTNIITMIISLAIIIIIFMILKGLFLFYVMRYQARFVYTNIKNLSVNLLRKYLNADYLFHLKVNSAELIRNIKTEIPLLFQRVIDSTISIITESLIVLLIITMLIIFDPITTLVGIIGIGLITVFFYRNIKKAVKFHGQVRQEQELQTYKLINQAISGIKEIKVLNRDGYFKRRGEENYNKLSKVSIFADLASKSPRLLLETLMISGLMIIILIMIIQGTEQVMILPKIALFAAAIVRLIPSTNRIVGLFVVIRIFKPSVDIIFKDLETLNTVHSEKENIAIGKKYIFNKEIKIQGLSFIYPDEKDKALDNVELIIPKNRSVGIFGPSGSGKTTLLNILLGLLKPTEGKVFVDGEDIFGNIRSWQKLIGFVPQDIYLCDDTIRANIAFAIDEENVRDESIWEVLKLSQLDDFVRSLPKQLDTYVGERGIRLSGGQRQRIAIARALWNNPEILIFDEATSALDNETEKEISNSIEKLSKKKTIIIVAHRLTTLKNCDSVFKLKDGILLSANIHSEIGKN